VNKPLLQRFWEWFTTAPTTMAYDDANDATRLVSDDPVVIPLPPPQHMRDVAGVAHVRRAKWQLDDNNVPVRIAPPPPTRLVDIPKISRKSAVRRKAKAAAVKRKPRP